MSREVNHDPLSVWIKGQLAGLHKREEWPHTADQLLQHITEPGRPVTAEDEDMLSLVVNDALQGVDIIEQYPDFYQKLLADAELRQGFLDALDLLERSEAGELSSLPQMPAPDLTFLQKAVLPKPVVEQPTPGKWRVTWQVLQEQLSSLFTPASLAYRSSYMDLEDEGTVLLRSQVEVGDAQFDVFLEAIRAVDDPAYLHLYLSATPLSDMPLPAMEAHLQWGALQQTAVIDQYGRARFQPFPLTAVVDETKQAFRADLQLALEVGTG